MKITEIPHPNEIVKKALYEAFYIGRDFGADEAEARMIVNSTDYFKELSDLIDKTVSVLEKIEKIG